jgi:hypothetical protein
MAMLQRPAVSKATKAAVAIGLTVCALAIAWLLALRFLPWDILYFSQIRDGKELIARIEAFKNHHGRLPDPANVNEVLKLGFELRTGYYPDYRVSGGNYELWYSFGFDGPTIKYWSGSGKWYCELCD